MKWMKCDDKITQNDIKMMLNLGGNLEIIQWDKIRGNKRIRTILRKIIDVWMMWVCVIKLIGWKMDGWIGLSGCGKWMDVESGKWRGSGSHTCNLQQLKTAITVLRQFFAYSSVADYEALGTCPRPLDLQQFHLQFTLEQPKSDRQLSRYSVIMHLPEQLALMSTNHSSFDQYCISHKTISHRAAAAPGPEVRREGPSFAPLRDKSWRRHCLHTKHKWQ